MSYEYKDEIRKMIAYTHMNVDDRKGMGVLRELDEIYRKAEAFDEIESIHLNMFGDAVRSITMEEAENFGMSVMRVLKIGGRLNEVHKKASSDRSVSTFN